MGFLAAQRSVIVVGNLCVDSDPYVCQVLHQAVGFGFPDHEAALLDHSSARGSIGKRLNALPESVNVPAGISAGLLKKRRIIPVKPEQFLGKVIL